MEQEWLKSKHNSQLKQRSDFYTPTGIHVYFKEPFQNDKIDMEEVVSKVESVIPHHLLSEIEMIVVGWFEEFEIKQISAFYKDGAIYVSSFHDDAESLYNDLIHEIAHSLESPLGHILYADERVKDEFLRKRKHLHDILTAQKYKAPLSYFMNAEYNADFDMFLYQGIGYDKLSSIAMGVFVSPYSVTSLREYYATGFSEFYLDSNHQYLKKISPALYQKLNFLQSEENLDSEY